MSAVLPNGYLTILQAADVLSTAMYAGKPDLPIVGQLRKGGLDVKDGEATDEAIEELWKAVDRRALRALAIGGRPRRILRLDPELTKSTPNLRSPRGRGFTSLRQSNPAYHQLASWFGSDLHAVVLAFRETEVQKLARRLMRARRTKLNSDSSKKSQGRPSRQPMISLTVREIIESGKFSLLRGIKALTQVVNRRGKWDPPVSDDTVARALDELHRETQDRRFQRVRKQRNRKPKTT
jgi:hypothetical protein